jgi:hypothetical protein
MKTTELVGLRSYRLSQILESKEAQALAGQGLDLSHFSPIKFNSSETYQGILCLIVRTD